MPSPELILDGLSKVSNNYSILAVIHHVWIVIFLISLLLGLRLQNKIVSMILLMPMLSVSALAFLNSNPFNGIVFLFSSVLLSIFALSEKSEKIEFNSLMNTIAGTLFLLFGLVYPHFINGGDWYEYLYKSPIGLIPCPSLLVLTGTTLLYKGFLNRKWMFTLSALGLFYGIFGVLRLDVKIDVVLIVSSIWLLFYGFIGKVQDH